MVDQGLRDAFSEVKRVITSVLQKLSYFRSDLSDSTAHHVDWVRRYDNKPAEVTFFNALSVLPKIYARPTPDLR